VGLEGMLIWHPDYNVSIRRGVTTNFISSRRLYVPQSAMTPFIPSISSITI
jgi:hypothetical protein